jgi:hypothetical protein
MKTVKPLSHRASFQLMVTHALLITTISLYMVMSLPTLG